MAKRVYELAKELNMSNKELLSVIRQLEMPERSHMSSVSESEEVRIRESRNKEKDKKVANVAVKPGRMHRPPIGKPIIDKAYLDSKEEISKKSDEKVATKPKKNPEPIDKGIEDKESKKEKATSEKADVKPAKKESKEVTPTEKKDKVEEKTEAKSPESTGVEVKKSPGVKIIKKASEDEKKREEQDADYKKRKELKNANKKAEDVTNKGDSDEKKEVGQTVKKKAKGVETPKKKEEIKHEEKNKQQKVEEPLEKVSNEPSKKIGVKIIKRASEQEEIKKPKKKKPGVDKTVRATSDKEHDDRVRKGDRKRKSPQSNQVVAPEVNKYAGKKKKKKKRDYDKFDIEDRVSLEKQVKKKYNKHKPQKEEQIQEEEILPIGTVVLNAPITVAGFAEQTGISVSTVIMALMKQGIMANINQEIDETTIMVLADDLDLKVVIGNVTEEEKDEGLELFEDKESDLKGRAPVITVMGHVDHGKTSLLDAIRNTNVTTGESGGITQHIGASEVEVNGKRIVFLDTPGHEAFTAMRARGAHITDIAVLVVAADDSVKPQTVESIRHAKAADVPVIVAINKMDKPGANADKVKKDLADNGLVAEDWGGDVICAPVSAKTGDGINNLLEMILLQAEVMELKANPDRLAMGTVIEARLDKSKGPVASLLISNGTLESGQSLVAGTCSGRIRLMTDSKGRQIKKAGPATPVEILGLTDVPQAGDEFNAVREDRLAREIAENRKEKLREEVLAKKASTTLEQFFEGIKEGEQKDLNLIIKGDVQGSVGAVVSSLEKLSGDGVRINIVHSGVGTVTESDIMLAGTADAVIIGFNVSPSTAVRKKASDDGIQIKTYRVIYDVIDDVENAIKGMLDPEFEEEILGKLEIRDTFKVPGVGTVGGAYVTEGRVERNAEIRLVRDGIVIHEGKLASLKRFKDDVKEVKQGFECGVGIESYNDIKEGDLVECYHMVEVEKK